MCYQAQEVTLRLALTGLLQIVAAPSDAMVPLAVVVTAKLVAVEAEGGQPVQLNTRHRSGEGKDYQVKLM